MALLYNAAGESTSDLGKCRLRQKSNGSPFLEICVCSNDPFVDFPAPGLLLADWRAASDPNNVLQAIESDLAAAYPGVDFVVDRGAEAKKFVKCPRDEGTGQLNADICADLVTEDWFLITGGDLDEGCTAECTAIIKHRTAPFKTVEGTNFENAALQALGFPVSGGSASDRPKPTDVVEWESFSQQIKICCRREFIIGQNPCPPNEPDVQALRWCVNENAWAPLPGMEPLVPRQWKVVDITGEVSGGIAELCIILESAGTFGDQEMEWPVLDGGGMVDNPMEAIPNEPPSNECPLAIPPGWS